MKRLAVGVTIRPDVMHELDRGNTPVTARDTAAFSKAYLMRLGYQFQH